MLRFARRARPNVGNRPARLIEETMLTPRARAHLMLLLGAAIWGFAFVAQVVGAEHTGPLTFNGVRFALGALALVPLLAWLDRSRGRSAAQRRVAWRRTRVPGVLAGIVLFVAAWFQQAGLELTTAGKGSFITGLYIVLVPVAGVLLGHRTSRTTWAGVGLALVGLFLLCVTDAFTIATGDALVLACAVFFTGHILLIDAFARLDALRLSITQFGTCAGLNLAAAAVVEPVPYAGVGAALLPILYGGVLSVGVGYTLQVFGQRDALPAHAALIMSMESVFGVVGGALLLGESMTGRMYAGCALMLGGIVLAQLGTPAGEAPVPSAEPTVWPPPAPDVRLDRS